MADTDSAGEDDEYIPAKDSGDSEDSNARTDFEADTDVEVNNSTMGRLRRSLRTAARRAEQSARIDVPPVVLFMDPSGDVAIISILSHEIENSEDEDGEEESEEDENSDDDVEDYEDGHDASDDVVHALWVAAVDSAVPQFIQAESAINSSAWALCQAAMTSSLTTDAVPVKLIESEASDAISGEDFAHGDTAYVMNESWGSPVTESTLRALFLEKSDGKQQDPFSRQTLARVLRVRIHILRPRKEASEAIGAAAAAVVNPAPAAKRPRRGAAASAAP